MLFSKAKELFGRIKAAIWAPRKVSLPAEPEVVESVARQLTRRELRARWRSRARWCADHMGRPFGRSTKAPAPGYFWKRDLSGGRRWRLYREVP